MPTEAERRRRNQASRELPQSAIPATPAFRPQQVQARDPSSAASVQAANRQNARQQALANRVNTNQAREGVRQTFAPQIQEFQRGAAKFRADPANRGAPLPEHLRNIRSEFQSGIAQGFTPTAQRELESVFRQRSADTDVTSSIAGLNNAQAQNFLDQPTIERIRESGMRGAGVEAAAQGTEQARITGDFGLQTQRVANEGILGVADRQAQSMERVQELANMLGMDTNKTNRDISFRGFDTDESVANINARGAEQALERENQSTESLANRQERQNRLALTQQELANLGPAPRVEDGILGTGLTPVGLALSGSPFGLFSRGSVFRAAFERDRINTEREERRIFDERRKRLLELEQQLSSPTFNPGQ